MDAVGLDGAGDVDEVFVEHGHEGGVVLGGEIAEDLLEGVDVIAAVVGRQGDAGQQDLDVSGFERGEDGVEIAARPIRREAAQTVVAAELHDDDVGMQQQHGTQAGDRVFGGGAAGALVIDFVAVAAGIEIVLQRVRIGLAGSESIARRDAVAKADQQRLVCGQHCAG